MDSDNKKIIVITGANKGIGYGIVELFLKNNDYADKIILATSRDTERGTQAIEKLLTQYPDAKGHIDYHQLEVTNSNSMKRFQGDITKKYKKIDILYNNAGVGNLGKEKDRQSDLNDTFETNVWGVINLTELLIPIIKPGGHIINVSSGLGKMILNNEANVKRLMAESLTLEDLKTIFQEYESAYVNNKVEEQGWKDEYYPNYGCYPVSKMFLNAYTILLSRRLTQEGKNIKVNAVSPGWCATDLGGAQAPRTYLKGAETPYWMASFGQDEDSTGNYYYENQTESFTAPNS